MGLRETKRLGMRISHSDLNNSPSGSPNSKVPLENELLSTAFFLILEDGMAKKAKKPISKYGNFFESLGEFKINFRNLFAFR